MSIRNALAVAATAAVVVSPAAATASTTHVSSKLRAQAEKYCKAQLKREGRQKFDKTYGTRNALGKCVSHYEKTHSKKG